MTTPEFAIGLTALVIAFGVALLNGLKWLRVAQRVHYLPGEVSRIERLWFDRRPQGALVVGISVVVAIVSSQVQVAEGLGWLAVVAAAVLLLTPWGLSFRGVTSPLSWTARARRAYGGCSAFRSWWAPLLWLFLDPPVWWCP